MAEKRMCSTPGCPKYLRADVAASVTKCSYCRAGGKAHLNAGAKRAPATTSALAVAAPTPAGTALQRMRLVCQGLGRDFDATLEAFAEAWLAEAGAKLDADEED